MSSEAVREELGTCQKEIRAEHVPLTRLHNTIDCLHHTDADGLRTCDQTLSCRVLFHSYQEIWITSPPHFIYVVCFFFQSSGQQRGLLLFIRIQRSATWPNCIALASSPELAQSEGLASPNRTCVCSHVCVCHSVLKRMSLRSLSGSARCSNTLSCQSVLQRTSARQPWQPWSKVDAQ